MAANSRTTIVLVVEDDAAIRRGLVDALTFGGYRAVQCADGRSAVDRAVESDADLVLLDLMLPFRGGMEVLAELRQARPAIAVILVTARGSETDRVKGLSAGADDYVVKPFSPKELLARVAAVLRRAPERGGDGRVRSLRANGVTIDLERREVVAADGERRELSERETAILQYLGSNRGRAVDRLELLHRVWGLDPRGLATRTVDMHIARLREKIEPRPEEPTIIRTVRAKGYMLGDQVATEERDSSIGTATTARREDGDGGETR